MKKEYVVSMNPEFVTKIQAAQADYTAKKEVIVTILSTPNIEINETLFDRYNADYIRSMNEYEALKLSAQETYMPEELLSFPGIINWEINYAKNNITFRTDERQSSSCDCSDKGECQCE